MIGRVLARLCAVLDGFSRAIGGPKVGIGWFLAVARGGIGGLTSG